MKNNNMTEYCENLTIENSVSDKVHLAKSTMSNGNILNVKITESNDMIYVEIIEDQ